MNVVGLMPRRPYQTDFKIGIGVDARKVTLALSSTGDIQLVEGREKLLEQMMRALVNDQNSSMFGINSRAARRAINTLLVLVYRGFREVQLNETQKIDSTLTGFNVYRRIAAQDADYVKISPNPIKWKYIDTGLTNNTEYEYGITRVYNNTYESQYVDILSLTPSRFTHLQDVTVGESTVSWLGNAQVAFYFDFNRYFLASELLDQIKEVSVIRDTAEPRRFIINILVRDAQGNEANISSNRIQFK
jgi:hypothetical protein